jgi:integrase
LDASGYDRGGWLSQEERAALAVLARQRTRWPRQACRALARLSAPIEDVLELVMPRGSVWRLWPSRGGLMLAMHREQRAFWSFDREKWVAAVRGTDPDVRQMVMAVAYLLCGQRDLHVHVRTRRFKRAVFARRVFGAAEVDASMARVFEHLGGLGYADQLRRPPLQGALYELMLRAGSPLLEDLARDPQLLARQHEQSTTALRHGTEQLARAMHEMGLLASVPFPSVPTREQWLARSRAGEHGVPEEWIVWARRWFLTSTLSRRSREHTYYELIKAGRWLARECPECAHPGSWTRETAATWIAAVDQMNVGDFSNGPNTRAWRERRGGPLKARTKVQLIRSLGSYFADLQEWEWIERRFDPSRAFAVPRSIYALIGPDPRVIADDVWAKLLWAGLNLTEPDLPIHGKGTNPHPWYPLLLVRAVALLWLFGGLRNDEIWRLRVGAVRWQTPADPGQPAVCLLDVPVNKTGTAFTKPVDRTVGEAIEAWEAVRPAQPAFLDEKTSERVQLLFAFRGERISKGYINRVLIPMLCAKAGVPRGDVRGQITSHRARATIASQLYNAKDPMTLFELQAWLGHRSPETTQHYAKITPTRLARAYTDAAYFQRNLRAIEVLLDRDAIHTGAAATGAPFEYYDLGHGYCTYSFFEQCPHRMACARCDFYLPKQSTQAQLLESKQSLQRMLVEIPLTDAERSAVDGDHTAVGRLIDRLLDVPTPPGPTPRNLQEAEPS